MDYKVFYEIDIQADSPQEAAERAMEIMASQCFIPVIRKRSEVFSPVLEVHRSPPDRVPARIVCNDCDDPPTMVDFEDVWFPTEKSSAGG